MEGLVALLFGLVALWFTLWLFILLPARMAEARGRSAIGWVIVSLFFSPILAVLLLWMLGDAPDRNA
ncbi:hypothetical protein GCM10007291_37940 [Gemmobacter nanjingensis]|uniref:Phospholipase_D-nuclease N-terminal n=1 Tax=Gemmobacter nanjingensis TaxID=488454 RepID=A0ABQ3FR41_9RHOB|nr:hypothetical protein [Gemmobacter nanjingensis]GHC33331.1 hypothetical protein GCM10007291_37940 [Gemmobacter nanjingensis]